MIKDIDFKFSKFSYLEETNVNRPIENEQYCNIAYDLIDTKELEEPSEQSEEEHEVPSECNEEELEKTLSQFFNKKSTSLDVENER